VIESRSTDARGWLVVARRASDELERAALRHEATILGLSRHPGVVEVVRAGRDGEELVTAAPTRATLGDLRHRPDESLRALAAAAETLADLHSLGIVHGSIGADAVLVAPGQAPLLDRFGAAGLAGDAGPDGAVLRPADDVVALADLVREVRGGSRIRRRRSRRQRPDADDLDLLLDEATSGRPPPARRLARAIARDVAAHPPPGPAVRSGPGSPTAPVGPAASPLGAPDPFARLRPTTVEPGPRRGPRVLTLAAAVAGLAAVTAGVTGLWAGAAGPPPPHLAAAATHTTSHPSAGPSTTATVAAAATARAAQVLTAHHGVLVVGAVRYRVGAPGDEALVADWGCRGARRVVVLRPSTGEVFTFTGWARPGHDVVATPTGSVPPHSRLGSRTAVGCAVAVATSPDGTVHALDAGAP
jgi:hypothetical protein